MELSTIHTVTAAAAATACASQLRLWQSNNVADSTSQCTHVKKQLSQLITAKKLSHLSTIQSPADKLSAVTTVTNSVALIPLSVLFAQLWQYSSPLHLLQQVTSIPWSHPVIQAGAT